MIIELKRSGYLKVEIDVTAEHPVVRIADEILKEGIDYDVKELDNKKEVVYGSPSMGIVKIMGPQK
jgi:hypothetical protein